MGRLFSRAARSRGLKIVTSWVVLSGFTPELLAQPVRGAQTGAAQQAISNARALANDINDDAPCTPGVRAEIERDSEAILGRLASLIGTAARAGDQVTVYALQQASRKLGDAVADYIEDCGKPLSLVRIDGYARFESNSIGDKIGTGVVITPGDPFFAKQKDSVQGWGIGASLHYKSGQWEHSIGASYSWGDSKSTASKPNGGASVGYVPGDVAAGPGVNLGTTAIQGWTKASLYEVELTYKGMREFNLDDGFGWGWVGPPQLTRESRKRLGLTATFEVRGLDRDGQLQWTDFPSDFNANIDQGLRTTSFMVGPAIEGRREFGSVFYVFGYADIQAGLLYSRLSSREDVLCTVCGGLPAQVDINDSQSDFGWRTKLQAGVGFAANPNVDAKITGGLQYGTRHVLDVRRNPTDDSTGITTKAGLDWNVGLRIHRKF